nr:hypothetical protein [Tanacetum cinerariifolium]
RKLALSFMRPFGCPVTILNTLDYLGSKANIDAGQARKKTIPGPQYVLLPLLTSDSQGLKSSEDEVANDVGKKNTEVLRKKNEVQDPAKESDKNDQEKDVRDQEEALRRQFEQESKRLFARGEAANTNSTNRLNTEDIVGLQDSRISRGTYYDKVEGAEADFNNLELTIVFSRKLALSFMRPFGCPVTILNTLDYLGSKANIDAGQARKKTIPGPQYVLLPLLTSDSQGLKSSEDEVANDVGKKNTEVLRKKNEVQDPAKESDKNDQEKDVRDQEEALRRQFEQESKRLMFTPVSAVGSTYVNLGGSIIVNAASLPNADIPTDPLMPD